MSEYRDCPCNVLPWMPIVMSKKIKVGEVYLSISATTTTAITPAPVTRQITAEKPETPEPLETQPYIYRPNDPFQSGIDEARAISSISHSHKGWVKKTWFLLFVAGPLLLIELRALSLALSPGEDAVQAFLLVNMTLFPPWLCYYLIWRKRMRKT